MSDAERIATALDNFVANVFPKGQQGTCFITTREAWYKSLEAVREQAALIAQNWPLSSDGNAIAKAIREQV